MNSLSLLPLGAFSIVPCVCEPWGVRDASHSFLLFFVLLKRRVRPTPFCVVVVVSNIILYIPPHVDRATTVKCIVVWWLYSSWLSCCSIKVQSEIRASAISWLNTLFVWLYMCRVVSWNPTLFFFSTGRLCVYSRRRSSSPLNSSNHWTLYFIFFFFLNKNTTWGVRWLHRFFSVFLFYQCKFGLLPFYTIRSSTTSNYFSMGEARRLILHVMKIRGGLFFSFNRFVESFFFSSK